MAPYITDVLGQSQNLYNNYTPQYYPGNTVAPQSPWTQQGLGGLAGYGNSPFNQFVLGGATQSQNALTSSGNAAYNPLLYAGYNQLPQNLQTLSTAQQQGQQGLQQAPTTDQQNISAATAGNTANAVNSQLTQTPGSNPYVDQLVQRTLAQNTQNFNQSVLPQIDNASQLAGGYGGSRQGIAQGLAIQSLNQANANTAAGIYSNQYNQDLSRQLQAAGLGAQISGQAGGLQLQGLGQQQNYQLGLQGQGLNAAQQGFGNLQSGYEQGLNAATRNLALAPQTQALGQTGINNQLMAGSAQDQYNQQVLQSLVDRWNWQQELPYNQLNQYANTVFGSSAARSGTGGGGSSGTLAGGLGGAATGAGIWAAVNAASPTLISNPVGWGIIGLGALLGSGVFG